MAAEPHLTLRTKVDGRKATWLELFYDLIYVIVIAKLAHHLTHPPHPEISVADYAKFVALFVPVWWAWTGHTLFANRFDPDDVPHRLLTLAQMFGAIVMAIFIEDAIGAGAAGFAAGYVFVRVLLVAMYARVYLSAPELRGVAGRFMAGFSIGAAFWFASIFVDPPIRYQLWVLGLAVDFATPWLSQRLLAKVSVHKSHLPERLGLLAIIVLGESVLSIVDGLDGAQWSANAIVAALAGFVLLASIWWLYFESLERSLMGQAFTSGQLTIYGHLPVYVGLVTVAAGIRQAIVPGIPVAEIGWLICGGLLLFLLPLQIIHGARLPRSRLGGFLARNAALNVAIAGLGAVSAKVGPSGTMAVISMIYLVYVVLESRIGLVAGEPD